MGILRAWVLCFGIAAAPTAALAQSGWFWQNPLPQGNTLNAVAAIDTDTVVAVGDLGTVARTTDKGVTWSVQHHAGGTENRLLGVSFVDAHTGTAVGEFGTVLRTTDGNAWTPQRSGTKNHLSAVSFVDRNTGTAVGAGGTILRTTDG